MLKNQKGMTLVELLAVMVIVGIIAAISIPAIGGLIENSRKDAAISTAQAIQEAARLYVSTEQNVTTGTVLCAVEDCTGTDLVEAGYLDQYAVDPTKAEYTTAEVTITIDSTTGKVSYSTVLDGGSGNYEVSGGDAKNLTRANVS